MPPNTISAPEIAKSIRETHEVQVPPLCPKTANPITGSTITVSYVPQGKLLEFYSLNEYIASFIGSQDVRDLELFTQVVARDCSQALGVPVHVIGRYILNIGQSVTYECES